MIKNYEYHPQRICSQLIEYKIDDSDNKIVDVKIGKNPISSKWQNIY